MKQNEIVTIILIISLSGLVAWFGGRLILKPDSSKSTPVEVIQPISAEFTLPDAKIFNRETAINPTERIKIGGSSSENVFE